MILNLQMHSRFFTKSITTVHVFWDESIPILLLIAKWVTYSSPNHLDSWSKWRPWRKEACSLNWSALVQQFLWMLTWPPSPFLLRYCLNTIQWFYHVSCIVGRSWITFSWCFHRAQFAGCFCSCLAYVPSYHVLLDVGLGIFLWVNKHNISNRTRLGIDVPWSCQWYWTPVSILVWMTCPQLLSTAFHLL